MTSATALALAVVSRGALCLVAGAMVACGGADPSQSPAHDLELVLEVDPSGATVNRLPKLRCMLKNKSADPVVLVGNVFGVNQSSRNPQITVSVLDSELREVSQVVGVCGNAESPSLLHAQFRTVLPGEALDLADTEHWYGPISYVVPALPRGPNARPGARRPGRYRIRVTYDTSSQLAEHWGGPERWAGDTFRGLVESVPAVRLVSNELVVDIE